MIIQDGFLAEMVKGCEKGAYLVSGDGGERKAFWGPGVGIARIGDLRYPCGLEVRRAEVARPSGGRDRTRTYEPHGCEPCALTN